MTQISELETISSSNFTTSQLISLLVSTNKPILINEDGQPRGVLLDIDSYQQINDTINMLTLINHSESAIQNGEVIENSDVFTNLRSKVNSIN
jgi:PHD/YefM family antitoxin component YafN of YafNO toxin-antitoxin module